jgi:outer membrane receptor protein involved in Fe transport
LASVAPGIVALPFTASIAFAQDDAGANADEQVEEIIVTGSRIRRAGFDTLQPAVQIDSEFMETRGFINIADAINEVPTFGPPGSGPVGQGTGAAVGQNFVNAFSLGSQRTLVLINGRRVVSQNSPGTTGIASGQQVDLNIIPTALIERVETIFNGGAPIYGADAVAATINIILKQNYEGAQFDAQYGVSDEGDADNYLFRGLVGGNFDNGRGNAVVAVEYARQDGLLPAERSIGRRDINFQDNPDASGANQIIGDNTEMVWQVPLTGVPLMNPGFWDVPVGGSNGFVDASGNGLIFEVDGQSLISATSDVIGTPWNIVFGTDPGGFDNPYAIALGRTNTLLTPSERWTTNAIGHYDITDDIEVFSEFLFARSESVDRVNQPPWGGGFFSPGASSAIMVPLTNPYVNAGVASTIQTQLEARDLDMDGMPDGDPNLLDLDGDGIADTPGFFLTRQNGDIVGDNPNFRDQNVFRIVTGLRGDFELLDRSWEWELSYNFGQTDADTRVTTLNPTRYPLALDAVLDTSGDIVCRSTRDGIVQPGGTVLSQPTVIDDVAKCVPINPMGYGNFSQEVVDYLVQERFRKTKIRQQVYELTASGDLFDLPSGTVQIAGGITRREEEAGFFSDLASETGQEPLFEQAVLTTQGEYDTNEYYIEATIPVLENGSRWDLPGIASLRLDGAVRYVDNSVAGSDNTWTVGARLRFDLPWFEDGLMIRGNVTQAIRSPSITEFFLPESPATDRGADPCDEEFVDTGINPAVRRTNCQAELDAAKAVAPPTAPIQSVTLDTFMSTVVNASAPGVVSGSTTLRNEISDSWTAGFVLTPARIPGLRLSADWTVIEIDDAIVNVSLDTIFAACYDDPSSPDDVCGRLTRNPDSFQLASFQGGFLNAAERDFEGLVVNLDYRADASDLPLVSNMPGEFSISSSYFHTNLQQIAVTGVTPQDDTGERGFEQNMWQLNLGYQRERLGFLWQVRWLGEGNANNSGGPDQAFPLKYDELVINNFTTTFELSEKIDLRLVINNVFDEFPSDARIAYSGDTSTTSGGNANFFDDPIGRRFMFGISAKF